MNAVMYQDILNKYLHAAVAKLNLPEEWVFQRDKKWLNDHNVKSLEWPTSPTT